MDLFSLVVNNSYSNLIELFIASVNNFIIEEN